MTKKQKDPHSIQGTIRLRFKGKPPRPPKGGFVAKVIERDCLLMSKNIKGLKFRLLKPGEARPRVIAEDEELAWLDAMARTLRAMAPEKKRRRKRSRR